MAKKKYEVPALEIIQLQANISVMIEGSYHDGGLGGGGGFAPERRVPAF